MGAVVRGRVLLGEVAGTVILAGSTPAVPVLVERPPVVVNVWAVTYAFTDPQDRETDQ